MTTMLGTLSPESGRVSGWLVSVVTAPGPMAFSCPEGSVVDLIFGGATETLSSTVVGPAIGSLAASTIGAVGFKAGLGAMSIGGFAADASVCVFGSISIGVLGAMSI